MLQTSAKLRVGLMPESHLNYQVGAATALAQRADRKGRRHLQAQGTQSEIMRRLTGRPTIAKEKSVLVDSLQKQEGRQAQG
jgi:hypothetical protein